MVTFALKPKTVTAQEALREAVRSLQEARIESASLDARLLLEHALGITREGLLFALEQPLDPRRLAHYRELVAKRAKRQPVAKLVGQREFWGMDFLVTEATLDPRPDSETVIETLLSHFTDRKAPLRILDLGTGTGCLLLALLKEFPNAKGVGVDISDAALEVAHENSLCLALKSRSSFVRSRWHDNIRGHFDIVVSNPPYIPTATIATLEPEVREFEPMLALDGGPDGLQCYRDIIPVLPAMLTPTGAAAFEIGIGQASAVNELAVRHGFAVREVRQDMQGIPRCILITHTTNKP